jgi:hypothetical protein
MTARTTAGAILLFVLAALAGATASAQTLGEIAKKEEERRKAIKSQGKVYTNDTVRGEPGRPAATSPASPAEASSVPPPPPAAAPSPSGVAPAPVAAGERAPQARETASPDGPRDAAYWRQRIQAARDALDRSQTFAEALQSRINALSADFVARDDPAQRAVIGNDRQKALAELDRVKLEIQQHSMAIVAVQDEARRANVPPGWLR